MTEDPGVYADAVDAYARAVDDAAWVREQWVAADRPVAQKNQNGLVGVHPLLKAVQESETLANRLRGELGLTPKSAKSVVKRGMGRPPGATSAADRVEPPKVKLRSVR